MRLLRKVLVLCVYLAVFNPTADYRTTAWLRALEMTSTSLDKTLRRRRSKIENDRLARHLQTAALEIEHADKTIRRKAAAVTAQAT